MDFGKVRRNVEKMISAQAPEEDIDGYLETEGLTPETFKARVAGGQVDPASPEGMLYSAQNPVERPNTVQRILRGADSFAGGLTDSVAGAAALLPELSAAAARQIGLPAPKSGFYDKGLKDTLKAPGRAAGKLVNDVAGDVVGNLGEPNSTDRTLRGMGKGAGDALTVMVPGAVLAKAAKAGGVASNVGKVLASQPVAQTAAGMTGGGVGEATGNPYLGVMAAMATPFGISGARRAISPIRSALGGEEARLAKLAENYGIKLTAGQRTGSRPLRNAESTLQQMPLTAGPQRAVFDGQRKAFNRAVLKTAGMNADNASPGVIDRAFKTLGAKFDALVAKTEITVDRKFVDDVRGIVADSGRYMGADNARILSNYADDVAKLATALDDPATIRVLIDGKSYKEVATKLRTAMRKTKDPELAGALSKLIGKLDDAVGRSMGKDVRAEWADVRNKYRNLLIVDKAAAGNQGARAGGDIAFGSLSNAVKQADRAGYGRGRGDLNDLSRVGDFLADKIPNSGTVERSGMMRLLSGGGLGLPAGGAAIAAGFEPQAAAGIGVGITAGQVALPRIVQAFMNSKAGQRYLANTAANQNGPTRELLAKVLAAQGKTPALESAFGQASQSSR